MTRGDAAVLLGMCWTRKHVSMACGRAHCFSRLATALSDRTVFLTARSCFVRFCFVVLSAAALDSSPLIPVAQGLPDWLWRRQQYYHQRHQYQQQQQDEWDRGWRRLVEQPEPSGSTSEYSGSEAMAEPLLKQRFDVNESLGSFLSVVGYQSKCFSSVVFCCTSSRGGLTLLLLTPSSCDVCSLVYALIFAQQYGDAKERLREIQEGLTAEAG